MGFIDVLLIGVILLALSVVLIPLIFALVKRKYWVLLIEGILIGCIVLFIYLVPTRFPYVDRWIVGKTKEEIVSIYGQPDGRWNSDSMMSYDLGPDRGFLGIMSGYDHLYYYVYFDCDGLAYKILKGGPLADNSIKKHRFSAVLFVWIKCLLFLV